ncbi:hypothetical protein [Myxococcus landrumensis]|uniref:CRIB domain-containing protein n=1 Tax=Myxococcus landrumensis TaxID=2813577 RepID=A0ABX7NLR0_9BACT|nr:hypothetical protein [Myxococcus landrumus]QSQ17198.1 hypothetical protein JY572_14545 [Myxococcus landrumus]
MTWLGLPRTSGRFRHAFHVGEARGNLDFTMSEKPKRLAPLSNTLRELFLKSGNLCAFPNCKILMMDEDGAFVGEVCHIEAAEENGERFNPAMTNEERRAASNLMLMCGPHHRKTDDVEKYPVETLRKFKEEHERRYSHPDRAILETLTDWTMSEVSKPAQNLTRLNTVMEMDLDDEMRQGTADKINSHLELLERVPLNARHFLGAVVMRIQRIRNTPAARVPRLSRMQILISDLRGAFRLSQETIIEQATELESYGIGGVDLMDTGNSDQPSVYISNWDGWNLWDLIARFCLKSSVPIEKFCDELDFTPLDEPDNP